MKKKERDVQDEWGMIEDRRGEEDKDTLHDWVKVKVVK